MKHLHTILLSALMTLLFFSMVGYTACKKADSCESIVCQNGGTCAAGKCTCPTGYGGTLCEKQTGAYCEYTKCQNGAVCVGYCRCIGNYGGKYCEIDLCKDVNCLNGGTCNKGTCNCVFGFEGADCTELTRNRYVGRWKAINTAKASVDGAILQIDDDGLSDPLKLRVSYTMEEGDFRHVAMLMPESTSTLVAYENFKTFRLGDGDFRYIIRAKGAELEMSYLFDSDQYSYNGDLKFVRE